MTFVWPYWFYHWFTVFALLALSLTYCFGPIGFIFDLQFWPCWLPCWGPHSRDAEDLCLLEGRSNISHNLGFSEPVTTIKYFNQHRNLTSCPNITIPSKIGSNWRVIWRSCNLQVSKFFFHWNKWNCTYITIRFHLILVPNFLKA